MRLERLQLELRPRNPWDAMDLGLGLTRAHWRAIYLPWVAFAITSYAALLLIFGIEHALPSLLFWWLKPVFDRWLLHAISHAAFAEAPSLGATLKALPGLLRHTRLIRGLTLARLSPSRSFQLPAWQLEGLRGAARRERIALLKRRIGAAPFWLTLACVHLELSIYVGPLLLAALLAPQGIDPIGLLEALFIAPGDQQWVAVVGHVFYLLAVIVIEPIYVAAGFTLYLQRRIDLEAWDLELALRRLGRRVAAASRTAMPACLLVGALFALTAPHVTVAATAPPGIAAEVQQTVAALELCEALHPTATTTWVWQWRDSAPGTSATGADTGFGAWLHSLAQGLKWLLWLLLAIALAALVVHRGRRRRRDPATVPPPAPPGYVTAAGSIAGEPSREALRHLDQGQPRAALALLYRAAHVFLGRDHTLTPGVTENELIALATPVLSTAQTALLTRLVTLWSATAYAARPPDPAAVRALAHAWAQQFGADR
ncbi:MAG: hypothetical protein ACFCUG_02370 [Thiotrichales bacterium]